MTIILSFEIREKIYNDNTKYTFHFTFRHICTKNFYNDYLPIINRIHNSEIFYPLNCNVKREVKRTFHYAQVP